MKVYIIYLLTFKLASNLPANELVSVLDGLFCIFAIWFTGPCLYINQDWLFIQVYLFKLNKRNVIVLSKSATTAHNF